MSIVPTIQMPLQKKILVKIWNPTKKSYAYPLFHWGLNIFVHLVATFADVRQKKSCEIGAVLTNEHAFLLLPPV